MTLNCLYFREGDKKLVNKIKMEQLISALDRCYEEHRIRIWNIERLNRQWLVALSTVYRKNYVKEVTSVET